MIVFIVKYVISFAIGQILKFLEIEEIERFRKKIFLKNLNELLYLKYIKNHKYFI